MKKIVGLKKTHLRVFSGGSASKPSPLEAKELSAAI